MEFIEIIIGIAIVLFFVLMIFSPFVVIDWQTGQHGQLAITAVDKNLFGMIALINLAINHLGLRLRSQK